MSNPHNEDLPSLDGEYHPPLQEVLARIGNNTLSEIAFGTDEGIYAVSIDNHPQHMPNESWIDSDNREIQSFRNKFRNGFEGWQPGDVVNAQFLLRQDEDGPLGLSVSHTYIPDTRHADTFLLPGLSAGEQAKLKSFGMAVVDADVEVTTIGTYRASNQFVYEARVHQIKTVQAPWDGETTPNEGDSVLVEGEVVSYTPGKVDYENMRYPVVQVKLANGRIVPIEMTTGNASYDAGNLDFLYPECLQTGDTIQINTTFGNQTEDIGHPATFRAPYTRAAFLLQPGAERLAAYEAHRADIAERLTALGALDGQAFWDAYSGLLRTYVEPRTENDRARLLMTKQERHDLSAIVDQKFPNDTEGAYSPDRPLASISLAEQMSDISHLYDVDVFGMSRREFYDFCLDVANGRKAIDYRPGVDVDYPFWILCAKSEAFTDSEQLEVYKQAAEYWMPYIRGKEVLSPLGGISAVTDPERQVTFADERMAECSIEYLTDMAQTLPEAKDYLYNLTTRTLRETAAEDAGEPVSRKGGFMIGYKLCESLETVLASSASWENWRPVTIKDPAGLDYFVQKLPELQTITRQLEAKGKRRAVRDTTKLINYILELKRTPPDTISA